jgi:Fe-S-cluster containining protein
MSIVKKVSAVEKLYHSLDQEIAQFRDSTGLFCFSGCGACCQKADIEATPLEFLPFAYACLLEGKAGEVLEKLKTHTSPYCHLLKLAVHGKSGGFCAEYQYRGLICRLFGYAAARDKYGSLRLITCNKIKEGQAEAYTESMEKIKAAMPVPVMSQYYSRLNSIDQELSRKFHPINQAMIEALETVLHYYAYRPKPRRRPLRQAG